jgi:hypothetical protein
MGLISSCCRDEISSLDREKLKPVLDGIFVQQKFTSKTSYSRMYVWINLETFTIHMSEHGSKERKHKEASLSDVTKVEPGLPAKGDSKESDKHTSLTITFKRGGGIDLKFDNQEIRDMWSETLKLITRRNAN